VNGNGDQKPSALEAAGRQRIELKEAVSLTEVAAALPAGDPNSRDRLIAALNELALAWDRHAEAVEGEDGLLGELAVEAEHPALRARIADAIHLAKEGAAFAEVRTAVVDVLLAIVRHRQKGADLVYEGYNVDIGGS
jgi:hypothetical protein